MSTITFTTLECVCQQDVTGKDEPYLFADGVEIWWGVLDEGDLDKGDSASLNNRSNYFDQSVTVTLKEKNPSSWKIYGAVTIDFDTKAPADFKTSGARYHLWYSGQEMSCCVFASAHTENQARRFPRGPGSRRAARDGTRART